MIAIKAVVRTGELQLCPVLMTCVVAGVGLLPVAPSIGIAGAEAACDRGGDRHDAGAAGHSGDPAGADLILLAPRPNLLPGRRARAQALPGVAHLVIAEGR